MFDNEYESSMRYRDFVFLEETSIVLSQATCHKMASIELCEYVYLLPSVVACFGSFLIGSRKL